MHMPLNPYIHHSRRQGLETSTAVVQTDDVGGSSLAFDNSVVSPTALATIPLASGLAPILTTQTILPPSSDAAPSASASAAPTSGASAATSSAAHSPSMTTVIAACVGAFFGAAVLIIYAVYFFKRYNRAQEVAMRRERAARIAAHKERRWSKLEKGGTPPHSPAPRIASATLDVGSRLDMFPGQPSPSLRSGFTGSGSEDAHAASDAALAAKFAASQQRMPAARADAGAPPSWGAETVGDESFLSMSYRSTMMTPALGAAKMTPPATMYGADHLHQGEAAVVVDPFGGSEAAELSRGGGVPAIVLAAPAPVKHRTSVKGSNPFFGSGGSAGPFADAHAAKARALGHRPAVASDDSIASEATMQSLLAALDLPGDADKLRITSMQPSVLSTGSAYDEDAMMEQFPLPPGSSGSHH